MAGTISAIVNIAYCISFSALIFQGSIAAGFPLGLAALIMGTMVTGVVVALTTTLVPADAGPDTPAVAVMSVLATTVAAGLAAKGADTETMIINVMVAITVSTFLTGAVLFGLGGLKLGQWLRFVPFPVIGGFLAASGFLLITGGVEVITGSNLTLSPSSWAIVADMRYAPQIAVGLAFALFIVLLKRWMDDYLTLPIAFFIFLVVLNVILLWFVNDPETQANWYLAAVGALQLW
ncbi:MAG: SulP family inorganic anion transporter, partial [Methyloceanibacter sp.]